MSTDKFVEEVLSRITAEHGVPREKVEYLTASIVAARPTEGEITMDELSTLVHGTDVEEAEKLQKKYPLLNGVCLSPYTELEEPDDEEDEDEDEDGDDGDGDDDDDGED